MTNTSDMPKTPDAIAPNDTPQPRRVALHTRRIQCQAYERDDGLIDIEAHMQDISPQGTNLLFKTVPADGVIHDMHITMTTDLDMVIRDISVELRTGPIVTCPEIEPAYRKLIGVQIRGGFRQQIKELMGGVKGCTHISELLNTVATTAMQARMAIVRRERGFDPGDGVEPMPKPWLIGSCHTYQEDGLAAQTLWPMHRRAKA